MDNQEITTTLLRQMLTNLYYTNQPERNVWEQAIGENTMGDLLTRRVGSVNRFDRPVNESVSTDAIPFTAAASFPMLEHFDRWKRTKTGVSNDGEALDPEQLKNIQTTVLAQGIDIGRAKIEQIARVFSETGIKSLFLHIHEMLQKHQKKEQVFKLRGEWIPVNPSAWRTREDMTVNIGLGIGTRESNLFHLNSIQAIQKQMADGNLMGLTVTPKNLFNTAKEIVKNANLPDAKMFFTDPGDQQAPEPSNEQIELQKMALQTQQQQQQLDAADLQLKQERENNRHNEAMAQLQLTQQANEDKHTVALENILTQIKELELKYETDVEEPRRLQFNAQTGTIN
jgi:hypothetical protein